MIAYPEIDLGMNLNWFGLPLLLRLIGPSKTKKMVISGNTENATTLHDWGFIDELYEEKELKKIVIQLKKASKMHKGQADKIEDIIDEDTLKEEYMCEVDVYHELHEILQDAITEDGEMACPECLYEVMVDASCDCSEMLSEAEYRGRKVKLNKPMRGDVKKFKVFVKDPKTGNVKKVNFGDPNMRIKKSNPKRRKSFRARHNCKNPGPKTKARYWSCRKW